MLSVLRPRHRLCCFRIETKSKKRPIIFHKTDLEAVFEIWNLCSKQCRCIRRRFFVEENLFEACINRNYLKLKNKILSSAKKFGAICSDRTASTWKLIRHYYTVMVLLIILRSCSAQNDVDFIHCWAVGPGSGMRYEPALSDMQTAPPSYGPRHRTCHPWHRLLVTRWS